MRIRWGAACVVVLCLTALPPAPVLAEDEPAEPPAPDIEAATAADEGDQPIVLELADGIDLLNEQIQAQGELLKSAQTEREQQLIRSHIRSLQKERRSLESLMSKLVGPDIDVLDAVREQQSELRNQRYEKTLDQEQRPENQ